ncbi:MAG: hypothetical protein D5R99_08290 [Methanocalculus sp. MSAO_Arc1]|uniref:hypothetical protein n=1 Tax=Methanocalculus TaxID=71151 RepID=UPI000FF0A351|nr:MULTISPECIES: hypothetical protein [unclassified Methanocalculus]MCP1662810.1 hypothetical protein [Methanocalculus sp. AMF5]RQD79416.1 MAG: hypothetical protein D5R99_08290 [Methanocalculus sp. MSAO_Arc1]
MNRGGVGEVKSDPETGRSIQSTIVRSPEEKAQLFISQGTVAELAGEHISQVTITEVVPESVPSVAADPTYRYTGEAIQCGPAGVTFSETVGVTFGPFSQERWDALMEETEQDPQQLVVEWYNEKVDGWERLDAVVNPQTRSVTAFTDHFTVFAMFISPGAQTPIVTEVVTPIESNGQILYPEEPEVEEENNEENSNPTNITTGNEKSDQSVTTNNNEDNADNNNILIEILRNIQKAIGINNSK